MAKLGASFKMMTNSGRDSPGGAIGARIREEMEGIPPEAPAASATTLSEMKIGAPPRRGFVWALLP